MPRTKMLLILWGMVAGYLVAEGTSRLPELGFFVAGLALGSLVLGFTILAARRTGRNAAASVKDI